MESNMNRNNNPVAKNAYKFNKSVAYRDKTKYTRKHKRKHDVYCT